MSQRFAVGQRVAIPSVNDSEAYATVVWASPDGQGCRVRWDDGYEDDPGAGPYDHTELRIVEAGDE